MMPAMGRECAFGFGDLFRAAHGRAWSDAERADFEALGHDERNAAVRRWAASTSVIRTEDRLGSDGRLYVAFWVEFPGGLDRRLRGPVASARADREVPAAPGVVVLAPGPVLVPRDVGRIEAVDDLRTAAAAAGELLAWWLEPAPGEDAADLAARLAVLLRP